MEFFKSIGLLSLGILKRLYYLIPSLFSDPFDVLERWFNVTYEPPQWMFWVLLVAGLGIAIILAYHELRMGSSGYKLLGETRTFLRDMRHQALELKQKSNLSKADVDSWITQVADFIDHALGSSRKKDFMRITEDYDFDLNTARGIPRSLNLLSNFVGDLADGLQNSDMRPELNSEYLRSMKKQVFGK